MDALFHNDSRQRMLPASGITKDVKVKERSRRIAHGPIQWPVVTLSVKGRVRAWSLESNCLLL